MSDSDENDKTSGVPKWQLDSKADATSKPDEMTTASLGRETVIEQARKFLEEEEVKNATTDKKIAFLEKKGLKQDEIQSLIGVTRNEEASSKPSKVQPSSKCPFYSVNKLAEPTRRNVRRRSRTTSHISIHNTTNTLRTTNNNLP